MQMPSSVSTRLQYQHKSLLDIIDGLDDKQVRLHPDQGKWSIFENIVHLQTYQHITVKRIKTILEAENPTFSPYIADDDPLFLENCQKSTREVVQDLLGIRKDMAAGILIRLRSHRSTLHLRQAEPCELAKLLPAARGSSFIHHLQAHIQNQNPLIANKKIDVQTPIYH